MASHSVLSFAVQIGVDAPSLTTHPRSLVRSVDEQQAPCLPGSGDGHVCANPRASLMHVQSSGSGWAARTTREGPRKASWREG